MKKSGDKRISYASAKYPWLEAVMTYKNLANIGADYDAIRKAVEDAKPLIRQQRITAGRAKREERERKLSSKRARRARRACCRRAAPWRARWPLRAATYWRAATRSSTSRTARSSP